MNKGKLAVRVIARVAGSFVFLCLTAFVLFAQSISFAVVGDVGESGADVTAIAQQMNTYRNTKHKFDFVLLLGDNVYPDGIGKGLAKHFEEPFKELIDSGVKFYAVLGNHDIRRGTEVQINYLHFNMGGRRFYSFKVGDGLVEFFALDSTPLSEEAEELVEANLLRLQRTERNTMKALATLRATSTLSVIDAVAQKERTLAQLQSKIVESENFLKEMRKAKSEQLKWLDEELPKSNAEWKIAFLHHAIFSSAYKGFPVKGHGKDKGVLALRKLLNDRFVQNKVDVVFGGHDHVFEKTRAQISPTGHKITYITSGAGSQRRKGDLDKESWFYEFGDDQLHSFLVVHLSPKQMQIDVIDRYGHNVFPRFTIPKP